MSTSLIEQIQEYFDQVDAQQRPVTAEEVDARLASVTTTPTHAWNRRGLLVAAATAVLVLLAGTVPLLFAGGESAPAESPTRTTLADITLTTVSVPTTDATQAPTTTEPTTSPNPTGASGVFGFPAGSPIRNELGFDITDTLVYIDEYINAIDRGTPEALFDPGPLGVEEILTPVEASDPQGFGTPSADTERATEQLALWAVSVEGTGAYAQFGVWLEYPTESESPEYDANIEFGLIVTPPLIGRGRDGLQPPESLGLLFVLDGGRGSLTGIGGLPPEAAAVSTEYGDATRVWQRPLFGMAVFSNTTRTCQPEPFEGQGCTPMEISVLDESGTELFTILTPVSESDHGYMITMPDGESYIRP